MDNPKIGELVRLNLPQIFAHCEQDDPEEIIKLSDREYCREVFGLHFAFLCTPVEAEHIKNATGGQSRHWTEVHKVLDHEVRVTNEWKEDRHCARFLLYLEDKGLSPVGATADVVDDEINQLVAPDSPAPPSGARYKLHAIGNAQNSVVRNVLGKLRKESFAMKAWLEVKRSFGYRCVYCSSTRQLVMDHAVPISIDALGEHKLGNLVPACRECNSTKGKKRYDDYLAEKRDRADAAARIATIEDHMAHHEYEPLTDILSADDAEKVRELLSNARQQVAEAATSSVAGINEVLAAQSDS